MNKQRKLLLFSVGLGIIGWISIGIGYTATLGSIINSALFLGGIAMCITALRLFISSIKQ